MEKKGPVVVGKIAARPFFLSLNVEFNFCGGVATLSQLFLVEKYFLSRKYFDFMRERLKSRLGRLYQGWGTFPNPCLKISQVSISVSKRRSLDNLLG